MTPTDLDALRDEVEKVLPFTNGVIVNHWLMRKGRPAVLALLERKLEDGQLRLDAAQENLEFADMRADKAEAAMVELAKSCDGWRQTAQGNLTALAAMTRERDEWRSGYSLSYREAIEYLHAAREELAHWKACNLYPQSYREAVEELKLAREEIARLKGGR